MLLGANVCSVAGSLLEFQHLACTDAYNQDNVQSVWDGNCNQLSVQCEVAEPCQCASAHGIHRDLPGKHKVLSQ